MKFIDVINRHPIRINNVEWAIASDVQSYDSILKKKKENRFRQFRAVIWAELNIYYIF